MAFDRSFYDKRAEELNEIIKDLTKKANQLSFFRLFLFIALVISLIFYCRNQLIWFLLLTVFFICLFSIACVKHSHIKASLIDKKYQYDINTQYIDRIKGAFDTLLDSGDEFFIKNHDYCNDLDLFGKKSLFSLLNISESDYGRSSFAKELLFSPVNDRTIEEILRRQKAAEVFAANPVFLQEYQAIAKTKKVKKTPADLLVSDSGGKNPSIKLCYLALLWIIPLLLAFISVSYAKVAVAFVMIINLLIWFMNLQVFTSCFSGMEQAMRSVPVLIRLFEKIELSELDSEMVKLFEKKKYSSVLLKLKNLSNIAVFRSQPLLDLLVNMFFPLDVWLYVKLKDYTKSYSGIINEGVACLGEIESVMSASMVEIISKTSTTPEFTDDGAIFEGENIYHLLINPSTVVENSISFNDRIVVITGSNMSGKTTLLRTIGTVSILSYMGAKVPASSLRLSRMRIMSSMRIADNLDEGISTFKAELNQIASIIKANKEKETGDKILFLIDEIFRGTNSVDRTEGALVVLKNLSEKNVCGLMTTHDYAMCDKAQESMNNIDYYHFAEKYVDDGIKFDYKLQKGVSYISNAKYLMKLVGIV